MLMNDDESPEVYAKRVAQEVSDILDNLRLTKGDNFVDGVRVLLTVYQLQQVLQMSGAPDSLVDFHRKMIGSIVRIALTALGQTDHLKEMDRNVADILERLTPLRLRDDDDDDDDDPAQQTRH